MTIRRFHDPASHTETSHLLQQRLGSGDVASTQLTPDSPGENLKIQRMDTATFRERKSILHLLKRFFRHTGTARVNRLAQMPVESSEWLRIGLDGVWKKLFEDVTRPDAISFPHVIEQQIRGA